MLYVSNEFICKLQKGDKKVKAIRCVENQHFLETRNHVDVKKPKI